MYICNSLNVTTFILHIALFRFITRLRDGLKVVLNISKLGNQFLQANKPWVLMKGNQEERCEMHFIINLILMIIRFTNLLKISTDLVFDDFNFGYRFSGQKAPNSSKLFIILKLFYSHRTSWGLRY